MSSSRGVVPAAMTMWSGNGPHGFGAGRPWPVDATPSRAAVWASWTTSRQTPASRRVTRCVGTPS